MRSIFALGIVAAFTAVQLVLPSSSQAADYVGSAKCKMCHNKEEKGAQYTKWEGSKHSKAFEALKSAAAKKIAADAETNAKCLECHKVGADEGVGCEACHGAGSDYKKMDVMKDKTKAIAAGLVIPDAKVCEKCHNAKSPTFKSFDFAEMAKKIEHKMPAAK